MLQKSFKSELHRFVFTKKSKVNLINQALSFQNTITFAISLSNFDSYCFETKFFKKIPKGCQISRLSKL